MGIKVQGKRVHYSNGGGTDVGDHAIILIHGAGMDRSVWQLQARALASMGGRVMAVDLPGHGKSEGDALLSIPDMANWMIEFMDAAGVKTATLIGHSMGSMIALNVAAQNPDRVDKLVLLGVAESMPVHEDLLKAADDDQNLAAGLITYWGIAPTSMVGGKAAPGFSVMGASRVLLQNARTGSLHRDLSACNDAGSMTDTASRISCPVLFVLGGLDKMSPVKSGLRLAAAISGAKTEVINDAGHMMMLESPNDVFKIIRDFLKTRPGGSD